MVNGYICLYYIKVQDKSQSTIATVYFHCENQMNRVYLAQNEKSSQQRQFVIGMTLLSREVNKCDDKFSPSPV